MRVNTCCYVLTLQMGCGILGAFDIIVGFMNYLRLTRNIIIPGVTSAVEDVFTGTVLIVSGIVLIVGTMKKREGAIFAWLCFHMSVLFVDIFMMLSAIAKFLVRDVFKSYEYFPHVMLYAVYVGLYGYFVTVVWSFYRSLIESRGMEDLDDEEPP